MRTASTVDFNEVKQETVVTVIAECHTPAKRLTFYCNVEGVNGPGYRVESWDSTLPKPSTQLYSSLEYAINAYNAI